MILNGYIYLLIALLLVPFGLILYSNLVMARFFPGKLYCRKFTRAGASWLPEYPRHWNLSQKFHLRLLPAPESVLAGGLRFTADSGIFQTRSGLLTRYLPVYTPEKDLSDSNIFVIEGAPELVDVLLDTPPFQEIALHLPASIPAKGSVALSPNTLLLRKTEDTLEFWFFQRRYDQ